MEIIIECIQEIGMCGFLILSAACTGAAYMYILEKAKVYAKERGRRVSSILDCSIALITAVPFTVLIILLAEVSK